MKKLIYLIGMLSLSACGFFGGEHGMLRDRSHEYRKVEQNSKLYIPANTQVKRQNMEYDIPAGASSAATKFIDDPLPPGIDLN